MSVLFIREPVNALTHFGAMIAAVPATLFLLRLCGRDRVKFTGMLIYGLSLISCYLASGLFHAVPLKDSETFSLFDHIGIYLLIAGTVTPIAMIVLRGGWRIALLVGIWSLAAAGITMRLFCQPSLGVRTGFYLLMGWIGCTMYFQLARRLSSHAKIMPMLIGGLFYSIGAAINLLTFPPWFSYHVCSPHEVFHVFVIAGSVSHYYFMLAVLIPFRRKPIHVPNSIPAQVEPQLSYSLVPVCETVRR